MTQRDFLSEAFIHARNIRVSIMRRIGVPASMQLHADRLIGGSMLTLASSVFPVPGGPTSRQPLGILAPRAVYLSGFFRKSTTSCSSSLAPSQPCEQQG